MQSYKVHIFITGVISLWIMTTSVVFGQQRYNPFEIRQRVEKVSNAPALQNADTLLKAPDTIRTTLPIVQSATDTTQRETDTARLVHSNNPFEVDHKPVRVSSLEKRREELKTNISGTKSSNAFLFWFLLVSCGLLAITLMNSTSKISYLPQTLYNENILKLVQREESTRTSSWLVFLYIIFWINVSVYAYLVIAHYGGPKGINVFGIILAIALAVYSIRHAGLYLVGNLFNVSKNADLYNFTIRVFNAFTGIMLIPTNFIIAYSPDVFKSSMIITSFVFIGILLILRWIRGLFIVSEFMVSRLFQLFVYLCAIEIAPLLIGIKFLMKLMGG
jgi:hypothetical protein